MKNGITKRGKDIQLGRPHHNRRERHIGVDYAWPYILDMDCRHIGVTPYDGEDRD